MLLLAALNFSNLRALASANLLLHCASMFSPTAQATIIPKYLPMYFLIVFKKFYEQNLLEIIQRQYITISVKIRKNCSGRYSHRDIHNQEPIA